jgi:hypothetical protein
MAQFSEVAVQLNTIFRRLCSGHARAQEAWHDETQAYFEKTYWLPLAGQVERTQRELEALVRLCAAAQQRVK